MNQTVSLMTVDRACEAAKYASVGVELIGMEASLFGAYEYGLPTLALGK